MSDCKTDCGKAAQPKFSNVKLIYFDGRGRGEAIRWILHFAKVTFEDVRLTHEQWAAKKSEINSPTGQLPLLEGTDASGKKHQLAQSMAIIRALAFKHGLVGNCKGSGAKLGEIEETIRDLGEAASQANHEKDEKVKAAKIEQIKKETGPRVFGYLEKQIQSNGGKHLVGESVTYVDILLACLVDALKKAKKVPPTQAEIDEKKKKFPGVHAVVDGIFNNPEIKAYLAKRKDTPF